MGWPTLSSALEAAKSDPTGEIAYRAAARIVPQLAARYSSTRHAKEHETRLAIAMLRALMTNRVALNEVNLEVLRSAHEAAAALNADAHIFALETRAVLSALRTTVSARTRQAKLEETRKTLQAASDSDENNLLSGGSGQSRVDTWESAEKDLERIKGGKLLPPPLPLTYVQSPAWKAFEAHLVSFDESWLVWALWLRFRLFGLLSEDVPAEVWPIVESRLVRQPDDFWKSSELAINARFAELIVAAVDAHLDEEIQREQSAFGLTFEVSSDDVIDVAAGLTVTKSSDRRVAVIEEVLRYSGGLLSLCQGNSTAHLHARVSDYIEALNDGKWPDPALVVMRGDALRRELQFNLRRLDDSDLPPLSQATERSLDQTVRMHNMLISLHPDLAELDRMLAGPGGAPGRISGQALRSLARSAETRRIASERAAEALSRSAMEIDQQSNDVGQLRAQLTVGNFFRLAIAYLWRHKGALIAMSAAVPGLLYSLGRWAVANEVWIRAYFAGNPTMRLAGERIFEILHSLPLL